MTLPRPVRILSGFYAGHEGVAVRTTVATRRLVVLLPGVGLGHGRVGMAVVGDGDYAWVSEGESEGGENHEAAH